MPARSLFAAAVLAAVPVFATVPVLAAAAEPVRDPSPRVIRVSGEGHVMVRPDVAIVHAGVEATGKDLAPTIADASARMRRVLSALAQAGIPERDVRTTRHDVRVERAFTEGRPAGISGYTVSDEVRVVVRDLAKLSVVLERVVAAGSNTLRALSFEKDDPGPEKREALARAVADARAKADAIAKAGGVALAEAIEIAEAGVPPIVPLQRGATLAMHAEAAPVSPGQLEIEARVDVTYAVR